jgi:hypothetical protein
MKSVAKFTALFAFLLCFSAVSAKADGGGSELSYALSGPVTASFDLAVNPTVGSGNANPGFGFQVSVLNLIINGTAEPTDQIAFYNTSAGGGLSDTDGFFSLFSPTSVQLYSGTEAMPTMLDNAMLGFSGPIPLDDFFSSNTYFLTITPVSTPEPASMPLVVAGIVALFVMGKKKVLFS